jgi:hypothetical protein
MSAIALLLEGSPSGCAISTPTRRIPLGCCARAASGHAAAVPPRSVMKSRLMCPQIEGPNLPYHRGAKTALCSTAKSGGRGPVRVNSLHYRTATLPSASPQLAESIRAAKRFRVVPIGDLSRCSNVPGKISYSITSSAVERSVGGTVRPSALAVLRLMTNSYFVGACTGRSAGFAPLRMRSI